MSEDDRDDQLFVYKLFGISTPRRIKVRTSLRSKIGPTATISDAQVLRAQNLIDRSGFNFDPYVEEYLQQLKDLYEALRENDYNREADYNKIIVPIVQIKGQAAMFGNKLASVISAKILIFLEHYKRLDDDVLKILDVYCKIVKLTSSSGLNDPDSPQGKGLISEMTNALDRYDAKFRKKAGK